MTETREMICILCPMGCQLCVSREGDDITVSGSECGRGKQYGVTELTNPVRVVTSSVLVSGGERPLVSVKSAGMVPKAAIPEVLRAIRELRPGAPVRIHDVLIPNVAGTGVDVVATHSVGSR